MPGIKGKSGRKIGSKDKSPRQFRRRDAREVMANYLENNHPLPLEVMLDCMRHAYALYTQNEARTGEVDFGNRALAMQFAKDAAPYFHAKLASHKVVQGQKKVVHLNFMGWDEDE